MCDLCLEYGPLDCDECGQSVMESDSTRPGDACHDPECQGTLVDNCNMADFDEDTED